MSDIHVLKCAEDLKTIQVVFHYAIPAGDNEVNVSWHDTIVKAAGGADNIISNLYDIDADDLASMKAGTLSESVETIRFSSTTLTNYERLQEIRNKYDTCKTNFLNQAQIILAFIGYETNAL
ncbi:MAG: hypothetical protein JJV99_07790 [Colwellia sp.]|nr:hypothetical protein [Colwellia sp.]